MQFNSETSNSFAESFELDQGVLPRCKNRFMSFVHPDYQEMSDPNPGPKLVGARNVYSLGACFWFVARREDDAFDDE